MKEVAMILFCLAFFCVFVLVAGVQKTKRKGEYLQPDNPNDYVKSADGLTSMTYEGETINPEEEDAA